MTVIVRARNGSHAFETPPGQRILYSALSSGIDLPHECVSGTCGSCKARVKSGRVEVLWPDAPGWSLIKPGEYLLCQCSTTEDCEVEIAGSLATQDLQFVPKHRRGVIRGWRTLCPNIVAFSVELDGELSFRAGQFAALRLPSLEGTRCYSMVNAESPTRALDFVIKKKPGGAVSDWMFAADRSGQDVDCFGPVGRATYDPAVERDILCVAGGSGIAGMMSILRRATTVGHFDRHKGHVFFGLRSSRDTFFLDDLSRLVEANPNALRVTVALSEEAPPESLRAAYPVLAFESGMVHETAGKGMPSPAANVSAFVAGPPAAVSATLRVFLLQLKINPASVKYDKFG